MVFYLSEIFVSGHPSMARFRILARCLDVCLEMLMVRIALEAYLFNSRREIAGIYHPDEDTNDLLCIC